MESALASSSAAALVVMVPLTLMPFLSGGSIWSMLKCCWSSSGSVVDVDEVEVVVVLLLLLLLLLLVVVVIPLMLLFDVAVVLRWGELEAVARVILLCGWKTRKRSE